MYLIKVKKATGKSWSFLTSNGGTNRLRIHAAQIDDKVRAETIAAEINEANKGEYEARVQPA